MATAVNDGLQRDPELRRLVQSAVALLEDEIVFGGFGLPVSAVRAEPEGSPQEIEIDSAARSDSGARLDKLAELETRVSNCDRCGLAKGRTQAVFARGNAAARLVFVGEGPGRDEDVRGLPFVGAAGQLLDRMIAAMGLDESQVYICNVVKCRPPNNRTPLPDEAAACLPYLAQQLELVAPEVIVALGRCAAHNLGCAKATGRWRGLWGHWQQIPVLPTYHPAFLLRSPEHKRTVWGDLQSVMRRLRL